MNPIKWYKGKKQAELLAQVEREAELDLEGQQKLKKLTNQMTSKHCPIQGDDCYSLCVHFQGGYTQVRWWEGNAYLLVEGPSCKLWGDK